MLPALSRLMTLTSPLAPRSYQPPNLMNVLIVDTRQSHITRARLLWTRNASPHNGSLRGLRGGDRLFPSGRRRSRIPSL